MANGLVELTRIALCRDAGAGVFGFVAVMTTPEGAEFTVGLEPDDLLSYASFQRRLLENSGWLFRWGGSAGRSPEAADEAWQNGIGHVLDRPRPRPRRLPPPRSPPAIRRS